MTEHATSPLPPPGNDLRARNLERNRTEVADVAVKLFLERGFDNVTIDDIAAAAGISKRTFFRYFETKEDAVLPYEDTRLNAFRQLLAQREPGQSILACVQQAAITLVSEPEVPDCSWMRARMELARDNPSVHAHSLQLRSQWETEVRDLIAEHLGEPPEESMTANVVAAAAIGAVRAAGQVWLSTDDDADLGDLVAEAFELLADGLTRDAVV